VRETGQQDREAERGRHWSQDPVAEAIDEWATGKHRPQCANRHQEKRGPELGVGCAGLSLDGGQQRTPSPQKIPSAAKQENGMVGTI
jgi:hypothetical protein